MDQRSLRVLEFNSIRKLLTELTVTNLGKEKAEKIYPFLEMGSVRTTLQETTEARRLLRGHKPVSLGGIKDIRGTISRIRIGGMADPSELLDAADTLAAGRKLKTAVLDSDQDIPLLKEAAQKIGLFQEIENHIHESVNDLGEIADSASPEISRIRKQMRMLHERIKQKLDSFVRSSEYQKIIQEPIVTQREGRFVIPIKQESRSQFPGIIHDQSASGATLFIEPMAVVEANSEIRQLAKKEQQEIERIIRSICAKVRSRIDQVQESLDTYGYFDFVLAKGRLSQRMDAWEPELSEEFEINLIQARHPLIGDEVVPVDIRVGHDFNTLVITGPNTGGKTVALKTLGLLVLMAQTGLHIPAKMGSKVGIFKHILADIGDEQSIEQSLSTFSGHMKNIISMLEHVDDETLILLDEIGAGTDPVEGAALAMAILEYLHARGAKTAATTHYSELKAFAYNKPGVENASVEFDVETLRPTYRLTLGLPGHSNAFAIAQRLGLKEEIISLARDKVSTETMKVDEMIRSVTELRSQAAADRAEAEMLRRKAEAVHRESIFKMNALKEKEDGLIKKAKEEAERIIARTQTETSGVIRNLRKLQMEIGGKNLEEEIRMSKERMADLEEEVLPSEAIDSAGEIPNLEELKAGMTVLVIRLNQTGEVLQVLPKQNAAEVSVGSMKLSVSVDELRLTTQKDISKRRSAPKKSMSSESASEVQMDVDLRGLNVSEAIELLEKRLDTALLSGSPRMNVIHGKGTGVLRSAIREYLSSLPVVQSIRSGEAGEGGDGVTVVYFS